MPYKDIEKKRENNRKWKKNNREKINISNKRYRENNVSKIRKDKRRHYLANKEKVKAQTRNYSKVNKEKLRTYGKIWRENNQEKVKAQKYANENKQIGSYCELCDLYRHFNNCYSIYIDQFLGDESKLNFHHIDYINNQGITLCARHHRQIHNCIKAEVS